MMPEHEPRIATAGRVALEALAQARSAAVAGKTSRGVFLRLDHGWVIFVSYEAQRGPLTLNLRGAPGALPDLESGSIGVCSPERIFFPHPGLTLSLAQAEAWQAPAPAGEPLPPDLIRSQLITMARLGSTSPVASGLAALLPAVVGMPELSPHQNADYSPKIARLQTACRDGQAPAMAEALGAFLGLGPGLTPSGDDLVSGFLLAANRWGRRLQPGLDFTRLNQGIVGGARRATSDISASLIACAAGGQADERLILALDGIVTAAPDANACFAALTGWGSSSGYDALVGMAIFLTHGISLTSSI